VSTVDRIGIACGYIACAIGIGLAVVGICMFWGPLRQVLAAPVIVLIGYFVNVLGRWQLRGKRREIREDAERAA
jgi:hypothetical protein